MKKNKLSLSIQPDIKFYCDDQLPNDDFVVLLYNIIFIVSFWSFFVFFVKMFELNTSIPPVVNRKLAPAPNIFFRNISRILFNLFCSFTTICVCTFIKANTQTYKYKKCYLSFNHSNRCHFTIEKKTRDIRILLRSVTENKKSFQLKH